MALRFHNVFSYDQFACNKKAVCSNYDCRCNRFIFKFCKVYTTSFLRLKFESVFWYLIMFPTLIKAEALVCGSEAFRYCSRHGYDTFFPAQLISTIVVYGYEERFRSVKAYINLVTHTHAANY